MNRDKIQPWHTVLKKARTRIGATITLVAQTIEEPMSMVAGVEGRTKVASYRLACKLSEFFEMLPEDLFDHRGYALRVDEIECNERQMQFAFGEIQ